MTPGGASLPLYCSLPPLFSVGSPAVPLRFMIFLRSSSRANTTDSTPGTRPNHGECVRLSRWYAVCPIRDVPEWRLRASPVCCSPCLSVARLQSSAHSEPAFCRTICALCGGGGGLNNARACEGPKLPLDVKSQMRHAALLRLCWAVDVDGCL